jgi:peptidyl-prolyl cis-trans isomerase C
MMRKPRILPLRAPLIGAFIISGLIFCQACTPSREYLHRVVVQVNDKKLTAEEFSEALANHLKSFNSLSAKDNAVIVTAKTSVVENFIVRTLTEEWAQKNQIFVRKEDLDAEIKRTRSSYPDDISFRKALSNEGMTYDEWEARVKQSTLERLVVKHLQKSVTPASEKEVLAYYNANKSEFQIQAQVQLRQIVLATEENAKKIVEELRKGRNFAELAKKYSITPEGATGGNIGWIDHGTLDVFETTFRLGIGQRSQILKSPFGYHIMEVMAKRPAKTLTLQEVEKRIQRTILETREQAFYAKWLEEQVLRARVFKDEEYLKQIQVQTRGGGA